MKKQNFLFFVSIVLACLLLPLLTHAQKNKFVSFVDQMRTEVADYVLNQYTVEEIANFKTRLQEVSALCQETHFEMKLYVIDKWIEQKYLDEASELIMCLPPHEHYQDYVYYLTALVLIENAHSQEANLYVDKLFLKYPQDAHVIFLKSHIFAQQQKYYDALKILEVNLSLNQKVGESYLQRGMLYIVIFDYHSALKDFSRALKKLEKNQVYFRQVAYFQTALIYLKYFNNEKKAKYYMNAGRKLDPTSPLVLQLEGQIQ